MCIAFGFVGFSCFFDPKGQSVVGLSARPSALGAAVWVSECEHEAAEYVSTYDHDL